MRKSSGINVGSIEEDIKILENLKSYLNLLVYDGNDKIIYNDLLWDEKTVDCINAIEHLLSDYARQKQINEEHQKENSLLRKKVKELEEENKKSKVRFEERDDELWERVKQCKNMQTEIDRLYTDKEELQQVYLHEKLAKEEIEEILEESIPKQKIKDKIEELKRQRRELGFKTYLKKEDIINDDREIVCKIQGLQELLQEREDK